MEELRKMKVLLDQDVDKRHHYDLENNYRVLEDKNRMLMAEVM